MQIIILKYGHLIHFFLLLNYGINQTTRIQEENYPKIMYLFFIDIPFNMLKILLEIFVLL